jgi:hypothetical protein
VWRSVDPVASYECSLVAPFIPSNNIVLWQLQI